MSRYLILYLLLTLTVSLPTHADVKVAVTVKPVHSLVSGIMNGIGEPALIMAGNASPHHYSLRPSERRILTNSDLIFWVGPELESFMPRILRVLDRSVSSVALIESPGLQQLPARTSHHHSKAHSRIDPHIWLSSGNAHVMIDEIANRLIALDPSHTDAYEANRKRLHQRISETDEQIRHKLAGKTAAYLSYHDAYQYFELAYGLNNAGFVSSGDEISPSAKYVHELREIVRDQQLHCLCYEAPNRPDLVDTLTAGFDVAVFELDAIGIHLEAGEDAWFELMHKLAETYESCL
jgi:zinc transport system substrate-binding protein